LISAKYENTSKDEGDQTNGSNTPRRISQSPERLGEDGHDFSHLVNQMRAEHDNVLNLSNKKSIETIGF